MADCSFYPSWYSYCRIIDKDRCLLLLSLVKYGNGSQKGGGSIDHTHPVKVLLVLTHTINKLRWLVSVLLLLSLSTHIFSSVIDFNVMRIIVYVP